jgi:hypothetical protein
MNHLPVADAFGGDQDALGVHAVEDVAEALALLADQVLGRHLQVVEEQLGGGVVHHRADRADGQAPCPAPRACRPGTPTCRRCFWHLSSRGVVRASSSIRSECSARLVQIFWPLTMYIVALAHARWCDAGRVGAAVGSVTPKACSRRLAAGDLRQVRSFCAWLPCRSTVPMVYIWAWQAPPLQPDLVDLLQHRARRLTGRGRSRRIPRGSAPTGSPLRSARRLHVSQ